MANRRAVTAAAGILFIVLISLTSTQSLSRSLRKSVSAEVEELAMERSSTLADILETTASEAGEEPQEDDEDELQQEEIEEAQEEEGESGNQQMRRRSGEEGEWSTWGDWTSCSRTCDGGVSSQTRRCLTRHGCRGESIRYRICNMQPCPESTDFRGQQCSNYNNFEYHGKIYEWEPHYDAQDPCSLTCRAKGQNIIAQLFPKVRDGTRCREGSLDMCINGKCQPVGCDLQLGSTKKVDACGVCGGNGSSCAQPGFYWEEASMSNCSVTCGGGVQMSKPVCKNKATGREVDERLCDVTTRPAPTTRKCNMEKCPAIWMSDEWGQCSVSCGGGFQERRVYCGDPLANGTVLRVEEGRCPPRRPKEKRTCNTEDCPRWFEGHWSGCSVTCGQGWQTRNVSCRDARGHSSTDCDSYLKPRDKQTCMTGLPCLPKIKVDAEVTEQTSGEMYSPIVQPYPPPQAQRFTGTDIISSEPRYAPDPWGACSVTCGEGIKKRQVMCKIFLEFSRTEAILPDKECPGKKPAEIERCVTRPCSSNRLGERQVASASSPAAVETVFGDDGKVGVMVTYSWRQVGFTPCSASCLAGVRESIVQCVRDHDQAAVSPFLCDVSKKPDVITQTCNDQPCPPRWNVGEFSKCSKMCGRGVQTRQVQCVHEVTRGNTLIIPDDLCPDQMPYVNQNCSEWDCRPQWVVSPWTKCSKSCGGGVKTRKTDCKQLLAMGQHVQQPVTACSPRRPPASKTCNTKPCTDDENFPEISLAANQSYVQTSPTAKKVALKVGGRATVFKGTRLKIRCPVRRFDRARIQWAKDHSYLRSSRRFRISRKGTLKIRAVQFSDSGVYICVAGRSKANITVTVRPRPVPFAGSDEDRTVERPGNSIEQLGPSASRSKPKTSIKSTNKLHTIEEEDDDEVGGTGGRGGANVDVIRPPVTEFSHEHSAGNAWPPMATGPRMRPKPKTAFSDDKPNSLELVNVKSFDTWGEYEGGGGNNGGGGGRFVDTNSDEDEVYFKKQPTDGASSKSAAAAHVPGTLTSSGGMTVYTGSSGASSSGSTTTSITGIGNYSSEELERATGGSGSSVRAMLIGNIKNPFGGSRGHTVPHFISDEAGDDRTYADQMMSNSFVLGKGKPENLEFHWMITNWSTCSESCGGNGIQMRATQCMVRLHNVTKSVDNSLCIDANLESPLGVQKCGLSECPSWETGPWSGCDESRCINWNTAIQRRSIKCLLSNGTQLEEVDCDNNTRPREKRECYNDKCRGTWKVGPWSECVASCGKSGIRSRILKCVWYGTQRPAGNACRIQPRPSVVQSCTGPACTDTVECVDLSKYCDRASALNMCRMSRYRTHCCKTCRDRPS